MLRKTHVRRYWGEDNSSEEGGSDCRQCWMDFELVDEIHLTSGKGFYWVEIVIQFFWTDETGADNPMRLVRNKRFVNPDDSSQWINVPLPTRIEITSSHGYNFEHVLWTFDNSNVNDTRIGQIKTVINNDVDDKYLVDDTNPNAIDPTQKQPPRDPTDYLDAIRQTNKQDKNQKIVVEVPTVFTFTYGSGFYWQQYNFYLDFSDDPLMFDPLVPVV